MLTSRHPEVERLAFELATQRGQPVDEVLLAALRAEKARGTVSPPPHAQEHHRLLDEVRKIQERVASRPMLDARSADEILGYDERGIFG